MQTPSPDAKRHAPAFERNQQPIGDVLATVLPLQGLVLEVASGTGQHALTFARRFPALTWQPSDADADACASIDAWGAEVSLANLRPALQLDVHAAPWPLEHADVLVCINMIHISPWSACEALLEGAGRLLPVGGLLYLYGPYDVDGRHTSEGNATFHASLQARDPRFGIRDVAQVQRAAAERGFELEQRVPMPANNQSLILRRQAAPGGEPV